jgi:hypothetical protein
MISTILPPGLTTRSNLSRSPSDWDSDWDFIELRRLGSKVVEAGYRQTPAGLPGAAKIQ